MNDSNFEHQQPLHSQSTYYSIELLIAKWKNRRTQIVPTFCVLFSLLSWMKHTMQLLISPSLRHVTVLPAKGFKEFVKVKVGSRRISYLMVFYSLLLFTFLLRFVFVLTAEDTIDGERKCSTLGTFLSPSLPLKQKWNSPLPRGMYKKLY